MTGRYAPRQTVKTCFGNDSYSEFAEKSIKLINALGEKITGINLDILAGETSVRDKEYAGFKGTTYIFRKDQSMSFLKGLLDGKIAIEDAGLILKESEMSLEVYPLGKIHFYRPNLFKKIAFLGYPVARIDISVNIDNGHDPREIAEQLTEFFY